MNYVVCLFCLNRSSSALLVEVFFEPGHHMFVPALGVRFEAG